MGRRLIGAQRSPLGGSGGHCHLAVEDPVAWFRPCPGSPPGGFLHACKPTRDRAAALRRVQRIWKTRTFGRHQRVRLTWGNVRCGGRERQMRLSRGTAERMTLGAHPSVLSALRRQPPCQVRGELAGRLPPRRHIQRLQQQQIAHRLPRLSHRDQRQTRVIGIVALRQHSLHAQTTASPATRHDKARHPFGWRARSRVGRPTPRNRAARGSCTRVSSGRRQ